MTYPRQIDNPPQTNAPAIANGNLAALAHAAVYANDDLGSSGLVRAYWGGRWGGFDIADSTHTFGASTTTYVSVKRSDGTLDFSTSGTNYADATNYAKVETVVTGGSAVSSVTNDRAGPGGVHGGRGTGGGDLLSTNNLSDLANTGTARTNLGLAIGTNVQAYDAELAALAGLTSAADKIPYFTGSGTAGLLTRDTDTSLTANSDTVLATQKAVKTYVDAAVTGGASDVMIFKGVIDASANPNYPAADAGNLYKISVAGKIGGASGLNVEVGDTIYCITDSTASGNQATVGSNWVISQVNIDGAYFAGGTDVAVADGGTGSSTASGARTNLGLAIGTDVQAHDADLDTIAGLTATTDSFIQAKSSAWASRTIAQVAADLSSSIKNTECICVPMSDETTALTTGTKVTIRMPYAFTITEVRASVTTAPTGGTLLGIDIKESGTTIFSTKPTFDASEKTTTTAATANVLSDTSLADDAEMTFIVDTVGSTIAGAGLKAYLIGHRT